MTKTIIHGVRLLLCFLIMIIASCETEPADQQRAQSEHQSPVSNRVDIPPTVRRNLGMSFAKVERRDVENSLRIPGVIEWTPEARREYRLALSGIVRLEVNQYQPIEVGDLLYRVRSPKWPEVQHELIEAEQAIGTAVANIDVAKSRLQELEIKVGIVQSRLESLDAIGVRNAEMEATLGSLEASIPRAIAELRLAETSLSNARRTREHALHLAAAATGMTELSLSSEVEHQGEMQPAYRTIDWIDVVAQDRGVVESLAVTNGAFVESPNLIISTVQPEQVRFRGQAMQSDRSDLQGVSRGRLVPADDQRTSGLSSVECRVWMGLESNPQQRTLTVMAETEEARPWLRAGANAYLEVPKRSSGSPKLAIPRAAVVKDGLVHIFFRRDPAQPNQAIRVEADMGADDGQWVVIHSGLSPTDEVVVDGAYELKLATQSNQASRQGGHFHSDGTWHAEDD